MQVPPRPDPLIGWLAVCWGCSQGLRLKAGRAQHANRARRGYKIIMGGLSIENKEGGLTDSQIYMRRNREKDVIVCYLWCWRSECEWERDVSFL